MLRTKPLPIIYLFVVYQFFFLLKSPILASNACVDALSLCFRKVIPSLFPFLIITELLISLNMHQTIGRYLGKPLSKLLKISPPSSVALICGLLFGFPLGTKFSVSLYENNIISKEEASNLICFCSNTGPGFIISVIGGSLGNRNIAVCIYICQVISAFIIALILSKKNKCKNTNQTVTEPAFNVNLITSAITSSVIPMLNICSFVIFFSVISSSIENIMSSLNLGTYINTFFSGLLELTNGINKLSYLPLNLKTIFMSAFFVGWSGVSVILQSISIFSKHSLNTKKFIISKLFQGIICALLCVILCKFFKLYWKYTSTCCIIDV